MVENCVLKTSHTVVSMLKTSHAVAFMLVLVHISPTGWRNIVRPD